MTTTPTADGMGRAEEKPCAALVSRRYTLGWRQCRRMATRVISQSGRIWYVCGHHRGHPIEYLTPSVESQCPDCATLTGEHDDLCSRGQNR